MVGLLLLSGFLYCGERGTLVAACGLITAVAPRVEHSLQRMCRLWELWLAGSVVQLVA